jgi:hypothetical protein
MCVYGYLCVCVFVHRKLPYYTYNISSLALAADLGSRYQPIMIEDNGDGEIDSEDAALSALLHERVVKVKQEIDWDLEEQKLREKRREKELKLKEVSSSDDESDSPVYPEVRWRRRNGRGKWAWTVPNSMSRRSDPKNYVQGGDPRQLVMMDPSSQTVATVALQPGLESDNPNVQDDTIIYSQHDNSVPLYSGQSFSRSMLDYTDTCTADSEGTDSAASGVPFDTAVRNHHRFQNNRSAFHRPDIRNEVISAGSPPACCDSNHRYRRKSEFLASVNSEAEIDQSSKAAVYIPTLDVHVPDYNEPHDTLPDNTTVNLRLCDPGPSTRHQRSPTGVKPCNNIVDVINIESQSSTEQDDILSGTASEAEDTRHFSTISRDHSSAVLSEARWDGNSEATCTSQSESESELETYPRPAWTRLYGGDDETGEELLLSGYESGYVETRTQTSIVVSSCSRSSSLSSTPPPSDDVMAPPPSGDIMTPPSSPGKRESTATSTLTTVKLKSLQLSLTPVCISPRRESKSKLLTSINPPLPPSRKPLREAQVEGEKEISKKVSTGVIQDGDEASLNPSPPVSSPTPSDTTARDGAIPRWKPSNAAAKDGDISQHRPIATTSAHLVPSTEPLPSNDSRNETSEMMAQDNLSEREDAIASCTTCYPWQSTESRSAICAHCPTGCSLCLPSSCSCHHTTCTYDNHMHSQQHTCSHNCLQVMSPRGPQNSGHTSPPSNGKNYTHSSLCCYSHNSTDITPAPCTAGNTCSYGDSGHALPTCSSNISEANPSTSPPSPTVELEHGGNHTHSASSRCTCTHISNSSWTSPSYTPYMQPSSSSTQEESHTHPIISPRSSHTLTTPHSCTSHSNPCMCRSPLQSPPSSHCNNGLSSRLFAMPTPQPMLPLNSLKRSREEDSELSSNSSENEISSPPTKRHCL